MQTVLTVDDPASPTTVTLSFFNDTDHEQHLVVPRADPGCFDGNYFEFFPATPVFHGPHEQQTAYADADILAMVPGCTVVTKVNLATVYDLTGLPDLQVRYSAVHPTASGDGSPWVSNWVHLNANGLLPLEAQEQCPQEAPDSAATMSWRPWWASVLTVAVFLFFLKPVLGLANGLRINLHRDVPFVQPYILIDLYVLAAGVPILTATVMYLVKGTRRSFRTAMKVTAIAGSILAVGWPLWLR